MLIYVNSLMLKKQHNSTFIELSQLSQVVFSPQLFTRKNSETFSDQNTKLM